MQTLSQLTTWQWLWELGHALKAWLWARGNALKPWQSLVAGLLALVAAVVAVGGTEWVERRKEERETAAIRASLAVEIWLFVTFLIETRQSLTRTKDAFLKGAQIDLKTLSALPEPTMYPATADRIGRLGSEAGPVAAFYAKIEHIKHSVKVVADAPERFSLPDLNRIIELFKQACQESLPLLDVMPITDAKAVAEIRASIAAMAKPEQPPTA
jgi:hypothetical protein